MRKPALHLTAVTPTLTLSKELLSSFHCFCRERIGLFIAAKTTAVLLHTLAVSLKDVNQWK